jgi:hypothetical protein
MRALSKCAAICGTMRASNFDSSALLLDLTGGAPTPPDDWSDAFISPPRSRCDPRPFNDMPRGRSAPLAGSREKET